MCPAGGILQNSGVDESKIICCILDHAAQVQYIDLLAFWTLWPRGKWLQRDITKIWYDLDINRYPDICSVEKPLRIMLAV